MLQHRASIPTGWNFLNFMMACWGHSTSPVVYLPSNTETGKKIPKAVAGYRWFCAKIAMGREKEKHLFALRLFIINWRTSYCSHPDPQVWHHTIEDPVNWLTSWWFEQILVELSHCRRRSCVGEKARLSRQKYCSFFMIYNWSILA